MGSMTDERRKEMEEEMMKFELEIAAPEDDDGNIVQKKKKKTIPANVVSVLPKVLKPPPPPPNMPVRNNSSRPLQPPPIPQFAPQQMNRVSFIPHQVQRPPHQPPRPPMMPMHGPPRFHGPGPMPFPMMPPHMSMPLPPMGMPMPMPHGFCPPPPGIPMGPMQPQPFMPPMQIPFTEPMPVPRGEPEPEPHVKPSKPESATIATPAVYAAPPVKSFMERTVQRTLIPPAIGTTATTTISVVKTVSTPSIQQNEEFKTVKSVGEPVTTSNNSNSTVSAGGEVFVSKKEKKKKKIVRMAGGQAWEDNSLMDWEADDFRIFCGDLGNDVTDEVLIRAFSKYQSFVKAKVIRDKRTNKTKGYGFVSFQDPQDFIKAMREMNGRYVGSRPIKLRKSTWRDRNIDIVRKKQKEKEKLGLL